jgi:hypothetical protein
MKEKKKKATTDWALAGAHASKQGTRGACVTRDFDAMKAKQSTLQLTAPAFQLTAMSRSCVHQASHPNAVGAMRRRLGPTFDGVIASLVCNTPDPVPWCHWLIYLPLPPGNPFTKLVKICSWPRCAKAQWQAPTTFAHAVEAGSRLFRDGKRFP